MKNKYEHPHLFKGTTLSIEGKNTVTGEKGQLARCAVACLWSDIKRLDSVQYPHLVFTGFDFDDALMYTELASGVALYLVDPYAEVLAAWELYLNAVSLGHKNLLSN